jgi:hypothetical protein
MSLFKKEVVAMWLFCVLVVLLGLLAAIIGPRLMGSLAR